MLHFKNKNVCGPIIIKYQSLSNALKQRRFKSNVPKTWLKFSAKSKDGATANYQVMDLTKDLVDDYVKFFMQYFVKRETIHLISGIIQNEEAMEEYSNFQKSVCINHHLHSVVCCPVVDGKVLPKIVGTSALKMIKTAEEYGWEYPEPKTTGLKRLFNLLRDWNGLYPVSDVMKKYDIKYIFEHDSLAVHPDYGRAGIAKQLSSLTSDLCRAHNVSMAVGWMTTEGSMRASKRNGWETVFTIERDEIAKKLNVSFENAPAEYSTVHFMIYRVA